MCWLAQAYVERDDGKFFMSASSKAILFDAATMDPETMCGPMVLYDRVRIEAPSDQANVIKCIAHECECRAFWS